MARRLDPDDPTYIMVRDRLKELVDSVTEGNYPDRLSEENLSAFESEIMEEASGAVPPVCIMTTLAILRNEFHLDYDDLVISGTYQELLYQAIARNHLLGRFISLGNSLDESEYRFYDATMNSVAEDYMSLADLMVCDMEAFCRERHYSLEPEDLDRIDRFLVAIIALMSYCWNMVDMVCSLKPSIFKKKCYRVKERCHSILEMSMFKKDYPPIRERLHTLSSLTDRIMVDRRLDNLQMSRNERYKQNKMRLYNFTLRRIEELNNELEACDPMDFTHRSDLTKVLEQVHIFLRSFDKDR
ncbi:MAG: hypothetical protein MJZ38_04535 [archaeon]|nr:hypothetical protein [archaeon]